MECGIRYLTQNEEDLEECIILNSGEWKLVSAEDKDGFARK